MSNVVPLVPNDAFRASGTELDHGVSRVWAKFVFGNSRSAHFFVREATFYRAVCGFMVPLTIPNGQNSLFGAGTYPKCKQCMDALRRRSV